MTFLTFVVLMCYGGGFGTMPAFAADYFGAKNVGPIYGLMLTAWGVASAVGPLLIAYHARVDRLVFKRAPCYCGRDGGFSLCYRSWCRGRELLLKLEVPKWADGLELSLFARRYKSFETSGFKFREESR